MAQLVVLSYEPYILYASFSPSTYVHAQMAGIGLRPLLDHHPLQFDITVHGQNRVVKFQVCTCNRLTFSSCKL